MLKIMLMVVKTNRTIFNLKTAINKSEFEKYTTSILLSQKQFNRLQASDMKDEMKLRTYNTKRYTINISL